MENYKGSSKYLRVLGKRRNWLPFLCKMYRVYLWLIFLCLLVSSVCCSVKFRPQHFLEAFNSPWDWLLLIFLISVLVKWASTGGWFVNSICVWMYFRICRWVKSRLGVRSTGGKARPRLPRPPPIISNTATAQNHRHDVNMIIIVIVISVILYFLNYWFQRRFTKPTVQLKSNKAWFSVDVWPWC